MLPLEQLETSLNRLVGKKPNPNYKAEMVYICMTIHTLCPAATMEQDIMQITPKSQSIAKLYNITTGFKWLISQQDYCLYYGGQGNCVIIDLPLMLQGNCKGCNGCMLCSTACNTTIHSTAPMCTATQCLTGITYTQCCIGSTWGTTLQRSLWCTFCYNSNFRFS